MNDRVKKWIEALRSDKYQQGIECLCYNGRYCATGVLCEVAVENDVKVEVTWSNGMRYYDDKSSFPPKKVREWIGIESLSDIILLNDSKHSSFKEIADYIEASPNFWTDK
jgi:hypothetical protein